MIISSLLIHQVVQDYKDVQEGRINPVMLKLSMKKLEEALAKDIKDRDKEALTD